jgi:hypothetical protein
LHVSAHGDGQAEAFDSEAADHESGSWRSVGKEHQRGDRRKNPAVMTSNPAYFMVVPF